MKKSVLSGLLVIILSMMLATVSAFAADKSEKKPIKGTDDVAITKQLTEKQVSDKTKSQLEQLVKEEITSSSDYQTKGYYDPVVDDYSDPFIKIYYPEPYDLYCRGNSMYVDFSVYDTWDSDYTLPVSGIFDDYGNLLDYCEGDIADVDDWTNYTGSRYLNPYTFAPGYYNFVLFNIPCDINGVPVDGWSEWEGVPIVSVRFAVYDHYYGAWTTTKAATEISTGQRSHTCYYCGKVERQTTRVLNPTLPAVSIKKPVAAKKSATVKWKKVSKANQKKIAKIQIQYSTDKSFARGVKTVYVKKSATSKKIKGLTSKKKYYVRIRAYKTDRKGVHVSKWSSVKSVKTK